MTRNVYVVRLPNEGFVGGSASHVWCSRYDAPVDFSHARVFLSRQGASGIARSSGGEILACSVTLNLTGLGG